MAPVGFRFRPTEEEIIDHYLTLKLQGHDYLVDDDIGEIDHLYQCDPWDLPDFARKNSDDRVWYFFCRLERKYSNSRRANRTTKNGSWKVTGKIRHIKLRGTDKVIGTKKNLVFQYKVPDSKKVVGTRWVIHEFQAKASPPDEEALVLCKLKDKADDSVATSPDDEGEPSRVMGSDVQNNAVEINIQEVEAEQLLFPIDSHPFDFNFPLALQSQNHVQSWLSDEDEDLTEFANSLLTGPDEYSTENPAHALLFDFSPPRSPSRAYVAGSSDRATSLGYGVAESSNLYGGDGGSKGYRQLQMAHSDDILLMGASSVVATTATRHEQVNLLHSVHEEFPKNHERPMPPLVKPSKFAESEGFVSLQKEIARGSQLQSGISSSVSKHKAREGRMQLANIALSRKQGFGNGSDKDRKIVQVNAKTGVKSRSNESNSNDGKGRFIRFETSISSHRSSPPSVYLLNAVLGLFLFLIMLREMLIVH